MNMMSSTKVRVQWDVIDIGLLREGKVVIKRYKGKITHKYLLCNRGGKSRSKVEINTLKEGEEEDGEKDGKGKIKRRTVSKITNFPT
ncbi:hypothetical protein Tco_0180398 [Tanacetum coccineum]